MTVPLALDTTEPSIAQSVAERDVTPKGIAKICLRVNWLLHTTVARPLTIEESAEFIVKITKLYEWLQQSMNVHLCVILQRYISIASKNGIEIDDDLKMKMETLEWDVLAKDRMTRLSDHTLANNNTITA